jgi:hypothetical protein
MLLLNKHIDLLLWEHTTQLTIAYCSSNGHKTCYQPYHYQPTCRSHIACNISATIKIPEPIIEPATIIVASKRPNDFLKRVVVLS